MKRIRVIPLTVLVLAATLLGAPGAGAQQQEGGAVDRDAVDVSGLGQAESAAGMGQLSGRQGVQIDQLNALINSNESNGYLGSNYLESAGTGSNTISDSAFGNASGIATVIQNTGNQVLIQNSMIVNLTVK